MNTTIPIYRELQNEDENTQQIQSARENLNQSKMNMLSE